MTDVEILRSALSRTLNALEIRNRGDAYYCLDEVFAEAENALKVTSNDRTHPDHVDGISCEDRTVGCSPDCTCCMAECALDVPEVAESLRSH